ncbi:MAG: hypothetical protein HC906_01835 [Bacteroidales bacterium]|nr:hypothetical protein [Bacteroidales bacterium]
MDVYRISEDGKHQLVLSEQPSYWGKFLRYDYHSFNFSDVKEEGMYFIQMKDTRTNPFKISTDVYDRNVWQPVIDYFLPIQMCHMRVNENYKVWHGLCHQDDALMAPVSLNHFDGYYQGASTLTQYKPMDKVPGLNVGGWHDAGDDDLRVESQAGEIYILALAYEEFKENHDGTSIDQSKKLVEINEPDGKNDFLQQIEHGALTVISGYQNLGRLYRGIICPELDQYVMMGDVANQTDNTFYTSQPGFKSIPDSKQPDDRWVFTEDNPSREYSVAAYLAAASRSLKGFNDTLSAACLNTSEELWAKIREPRNRGEWISKIHASNELFVTTGNEKYKSFLLNFSDTTAKYIAQTGWFTVKTLLLMNNRKYSEKISKALTGLASRIKDQGNETPYGVPYRPQIWGAGWGIQDFGVEQYFLYKSFPELFPKEYMLNALNFVLGCHPGENTASFASGIGSKSVTAAYGYNRADYSYIPGGVVSGTALIRPDLPELKDFPFLWQQTEYVLGGGSSNFMFLVLAARNVMSEYGVQNQIK